MFASMLCAVVVPFAYAQRGIGEPVGVAGQAVKPDVATLVGTVAKVDTGPCESTTGGSLLGTHFLLEGANGKMLNIHLGPAAAVKTVADDLVTGMEITVEAFRTKEMQDGHFVAKSLSYGERTVVLRDESLRPVWAGGGRGWRSGENVSRGAGYGWRAGMGRGRGFGRGTRGWGARWGR
jgi:hypothetical protein